MGDMLLDGSEVKILLIEDSEEDAYLIVRELKKSGFKVYYKRVETERDFITALYERVWDIILVDYNLPRFDFHRVLELHKKMELDVPLILVSGGITVENAVKAMLEGVQDYIYKDNLLRLGPVVIRELRNAKIRAAQKEGEKRLKKELKWRDFFTELHEKYPSFTLDTFLEWALRQMIGLTESTSGFIRIFSLKIREVKLHIYVDRPENRCRVIPPEEWSIDGAGLWFDPVRFNKPLICNEYQGLSNRKELPEGHIKLTRFLVVSAKERGEEVCVIGVANKEGEYNEQDSGMLQIGVDTVQRIMDLKRAEDELKRSEEKYRSIFENAVEGIYQSSPEGHFIMANPALARIYGYESPEELIASVRDIGKQLYADEQERKRFKEIIRKSGFVKGFEHKAYKKNGEVIWVSLTSRAVKDESGKVIYYEGIVEDITGRKMAEMAVREYAEKLRKNLIGTIQTISMIVEVRDPYTSGHQKRVSQLARVIAQEVGLPSEVTENIRMAALIHDIGKISVPSEILSKPTRLTDIEMSLIKIHPQAGYDIVKNVDLPYPIAEIILQHHERLNGSGYPRGIKDGEILLESQIVAIADVVEAISTHRPYRPALGVEVALEEIERQKGIHFNPDLVDVCIRIFRKKGFTFTQ